MNSLTPAQRLEMFPATDLELERLTDNLEIAYQELAQCQEPIELDSGDVFETDERSSIYSDICNMEAELADYVHTCDEDYANIPF